LRPASILYCWIDDVCHLFRELRPEMLQDGPNLNLNGLSICDNYQVNGTIAMTGVRPSIDNTHLSQRSQKLGDGILLRICVRDY